MRELRWASMIGLLVACKSPSHDRAATDIIPPRTSTSTATSTPTSTSTPTATATSTSTPTATSTSSSHLDQGPAVPTRSAAIDPSAPACRVLRGPIELPLRAPASLALRGDTLDAVLNDDGHPRIISFPAVPIPSAPLPTSRELPEGERTGGAAVPCAVTAQHVFCPDRLGAVHRTTRGGGEDHIVASSRPASRIAAATVGGAHVAVAYLASRHTSEGWVSEAWLAADDEPPLRVSEDGSGATAVALAPRSVAILALMIDARTALTAMHARTIAYDKALRLGEDAVVFVGGPGDRRTRAALAVQQGGPAWSFLPIARDVGSFGLAMVRIDEPPRVDEPVFWSMYPNGLDPAPVAATEGADRHSAPWVARVRPQAAEPASPRVLELGQIAADGAFAVRHTIPTIAIPTDVALAVDSFGALWLTWVDGGGSWLERLACR